MLKANTVLSTSQLVDKVHGLAVSMGSYVVSDVIAEAGEGVGGILSGTGLTSGSIARSGTCGGGRSVGVETRIDNELADVGGFLEGDRGRFGKEVLC